jgi:hypothetical protein
MSADVVVVIGAGGTGQAIARRQRSGRTVLLADYNAAGLGPVVNVVNTAGLSPVQAPPAAILAVDLVGTALVFEEFETVIAPGGAGLVISSMAGHMPPPLGRERGSPGTPNDPPCLRRPAGGYLEPCPSATPRGRTTTSCFPITSPP